ncbi:MAG: nucleotide exchange factor GrpE [Patescibacteria group bacterium]|jgi:molecular chaperone GrpE
MEEQQQPHAASEPSAADDSQELTSARAEAVDNLAGWKRANADYANLKKDMERMREEFTKFACGSLVAELLPVLDSFRKAAAGLPTGADGGPPDVAQLQQWVGGVDRIRQQLETVMKKAGVTAIEAAGAEFDPALHEAMMTRRQEGVASGQVVEVLETGYRLHDRVLRAAKVIVAE